MENEKIKEILEKQLELLSELSKNCSEEVIAPITNAMVGLATILCLH